jgi:pyruvate dehydrogenase E1 component
MYQEQESIFYYLTLYNEVVETPPLPECEGVTEGILRGMYHLARVAPENREGQAPRAQLFGSGTILREARRAQELLAEQFGVASDLWSVTSYNLLARDARDAARHNRLHPGEEPRRSFLEQTLSGIEGPCVAATDYMQLVPEQIRPWTPGPYLTLGTDGFGRSDTRGALREFFEVNAEHIALAALTGLAQRDQFDRDQLPQAIRRLNIDPNKPNPVMC